MMMWRPRKQFICSAAPDWTKTFFDKIRLLIFRNWVCHWYFSETLFNYSEQFPHKYKKVFFPFEFPFDPSWTPHCLGCVLVPVCCSKKIYLLMQKKRHQEFLFSKIRFPPLFKGRNTWIVFFAHGNSSPSGGTQCHLVSGLPTIHWFMDVSG